MAAIEAKLNTGSSECGNRSRKEAILSGMGGLGKTQIGLEYAYRLQDHYSGIFWLDGKNADTIDSSWQRILERLIAHYSTKYPNDPDFARVAADLDIKGQLTPDGQLVRKPTKMACEIVKDWLARPGNDNWFLVIDGYDNVKELCMSNNVPCCNHGHILLSSRVRAVCEEVGGEVIEVPEFDTRTGLSLLINSTGCVLEELQEKGSALPSPCEILRG